MQIKLHWDLKLVGLGALLVTETTRRPGIGLTLDLTL